MLLCLLQHCSFYFRRRFSFIRLLIMDARSSVHSPDLFLRNTAQLPSTDFVSVSYNLQSASLSPGSLTHMALSPRIVIPNMTMSDSRAAMEDNR